MATGGSPSKVHPRRHGRRARPPASVRGGVPRRAVAAPVAASPSSPPAGPPALAASDGAADGRWPMWLPWCLPSPPPPTKKQKIIGKKGTVSGQRKRGALSPRRPTWGGTAGHTHEGPPSQWRRGLDGAAKAAPRDAATTDTLTPPPRQRPPVVMGGGSPISPKLLSLSALLPVASFNPPPSSRRATPVRLPETTRSLRPCTLPALLRVTECDSDARGTEDRPGSPTDVERRWDYVTVQWWSLCTRPCSRWSATRRPPWWTPGTARTGGGGGCTGVRRPTECPTLSRLGSATVPAAA